MNSITSSILNSNFNKQKKKKIYVVEIGIIAFKKFVPNISWKFRWEPKLKPSFWGPFANIGARNDS